MPILEQTDFSVFSIHGRTLIAGSRGGVYLCGETLERYFENPALLSGEERTGVEEELGRIKNRELQMETLPPMPARSLRALCLNITAGCNLKCTYCFAHAPEKKAAHMSEETARAAVDMLIEKSDPDALLQIDFFGGEPLLNFPLIGKTAEYAEKTGREIKFTLTTNALALSEEKIDELKSRGISLILSLDGDKETNDQFRLTAEGGSSWEKVTENIRKAIASFEGKNYYVRGTFTPHSLSLTDTCRFFAENGMYNFSLEPAKGNSRDVWAITEKDVPRIEQEYESMAAFFLRNRNIPLDFFHFNVYLDSPLCASRRLSGCGAGVEYLSVSPEGNLYPCHQLHEADFHMGTTKEYDGGRFDAVRELFRRNTLFAKKDCGGCWARFYCSGGCHASSWIRHGDITVPDRTDCALQKKRIQCALWLETLKKTGSDRKNREEKQT